MKFSIITCSYNNQEGLKAAVEALRAQLNPVVENGNASPEDDSGPCIEVEHIIMDGGSSDGTGEWLAQYAGSLETEAVASGRYSFRWISEPDQGLYDALNKGMELATGDVIGILHTDDVWEPDVLKRVAQAFRAEKRIHEREEGTPIEGVYGDLLYVEAEDISKIKRVWRSGSYEKRKWWNGWMPPHPALFVTRELAGRVGEYRLDLGSAADYEWMLRACVVHKAALSHVPAFLVRMRVGGQSNVTTQARLKANSSDRKAWEINDLRPKPWTLLMKPIRKLPQWIVALFGKAG